MWCQISNLSHVFFRHKTLIYLLAPISSFELMAWHLLFFFPKQSKEVVKKYIPSRYWAEFNPRHCNMSTEPSHQHCWSEHCHGEDTRDLTPWSSLEGSTPRITIGDSRIRDHSWRCLGHVVHFVGQKHVFSPLNHPHSLISTILT